MKTTAAILIEQKKPLVIDEVEIPKLKYGQVLVKIEATRICGSQIGEIDGVKGEDKYLPHLLGHEGGGTVLEIGPEVKHVKPNDRVVLHWRPGAGIKASCPVYQWGSRVVNSGNITTFSRYAIISEDRMTTVPKETDLEVCCLLADTLTTGFGVVCNDAQVRIGESIVLIGCGGIGLGAVLGAKLAGAFPIIAVDLYDHKLNLAKEYGATHTINSSEEDFAVAIHSILDDGADVVIDGTGNPDVLARALNLTGSGGRCVGFGVMPFDRKISFNTLPLHLGKTLSGSEGGQSRPAEDIPRIIRMINAGIFNPNKFVSHRIKLDEINDGIEKMREGEVSHCIIHFNNEP